MWDKLIDNIDEDTEFSDDLFFEILETADVLEKAQLLERIRKKCKKVDRLEEFERLLNAWELKCALVNKECGTQPALKFNKSINITNVEEERREACCIHNSKGEVIGVKDCMVEEIIKYDYPIFILGGIPYLYDRGVFTADKTGALLKSIIKKHLPINQMKSTVINRIYNLFLQDYDIEISEEELNQYPSTCIPFKDCLYDVLTGEIQEYKPEYLVINRIPYNYADVISFKNENGIDRFLEQALLPEDKKTVLEFFGNCLSINNTFQKMIILKGGRGTGKSVLLSLLEMAVGKENIANVPLQNIEEKFHSIQLLHKTVNICADLSALPLKTTNSIKLITGGDYITDSYKGRDLITFKPYCKCIFSCNTIPLVLDNDVSNAFYKRLCIIQMDNAPNKPDRGLLSKLKKEIPRLIYLALEAYKQALERGFLFESENSKRLVKELYADSDSAQDFLDKCTIRQIGASVLKSDLYRRYWTFCAEEDRQPLTKQSFNRRLRSKGLREYRSNGERWKEIQLIN